MNESEKIKYRWAAIDRAKKFSSCNEVDAVGRDPRDGPCPVCQAAWKQTDPLDPDYAWFLEHRDPSEYKQ